MDRWFRAVGESERRQIGHRQEFVSSSRTWKSKYKPGSTLSWVEVFKALLRPIDYYIIRMRRRDSRAYILGLPFDLSTLIHHQKSLYRSDGGITSADALKLSVYWLRYTACTHAYLHLSVSIANETETETVVSLTSYHRKVLSQLEIATFQLCYGVRHLVFA